MLRNLYNRVLALAGHRRATTWLAVVSFAESSVFPIPPDAMLVPMCLARPDRVHGLGAPIIIINQLGAALQAPVLCVGTKL